MSVKTYTGIVEHGRIRFDNDITFPENAKVYVIVPDEEKENKITLEELISKMPEDYKVQEVDFGEPVGKEDIL